MANSLLEREMEEICRGALPELVRWRVCVADCPTTTVLKLKLFAETTKAGVGVDVCEL
jgi:hypothetical protein